MLNQLGSIAKAILAGGIAFIGSLSTALIDDKSLGEVTDGQWVTAVGAFLVALGGVYLVPNRKPSE